LPAAPEARGLSANVAALLRSRTTWRIHRWALLAVLGIPLHYAAIVVFPVAPLWARAWAALTLRLLTGPGAAEAPGEWAGGWGEWAAAGRVGGRDGDLGGAPGGGPGRGAGRGAGRGEGGGHGLIGMRERVAALDGQFAFGTLADGGFEVRAVLPFPPRAEPAPGGGRPGEGTAEVGESAETGGPASSAETGGPAWSAETGGPAWSAEQTDGEAAR
jgi:hypothetical protein